MVLRAAAALLAFATSSVAAGWLPTTVFVQGGASSRGDSVDSASAGVAWAWSWRADFAGGEVTGATELFASGWRADAIGGGRRTFVQVGLVPMLRWRGSRGASPWFLEAGIGAAATDLHFVTAQKRFGTRLNFSDNLAVGRSFGPAGQHEMSLRVQHTSNAGVRRPNPGLDLVLVRYATRF